MSPIEVVFNIENHLISRCRTSFEPNKIAQCYYQLASIYPWVLIHFYMLEFTTRITEPKPIKGSLKQYQIKYPYGKKNLTHDLLFLMVSQIKKILPEEAWQKLATNRQSQRPRSAPWKREGILIWNPSSCAHTNLRTVLKD